MENREFIVPPPGLFPAHQDTERVAPRPIPQALPVFTPTVPEAALHTIPPVLAQAQAPVLGSWRLALADGQHLVVNSALVIGRDPAPIAARPQGTLVSVTDPARSVSKTHAIIELEAGELAITELHSTNGVVVTHADGTRIELEAGARERLQANSRVQLGDFLITVSREVVGA